MRHFAVFDVDGSPSGFWNDDVYPPDVDGARHPAIPAEAVEITFDAWQELMANPGRRRFVDGAIAVFEPPPPPPAPPAVPTPTPAQLGAILGLTPDQVLALLRAAAAIAA